MSQPAGMGLLGLGYRYMARPVLFRLGRGDAEVAHHRTLAVLARLQQRPATLRTLARLLAVPAAPRTVFGLNFPNPVGLAAGADKDGIALAAWPALGFGFVEAGTVTAVAQPGNPRPRVFRLVDSGGVINRMGFPNAGAAALAERCAATGPIGVPLGISLGKSKVTPVGEAVADYVASLRVVEPRADYVAVNVSSPNTPGLRGLQDRGALDELLAALVGEARALGAARSPTSTSTLAGEPRPAANRPDHHDDDHRRDHSQMRDPVPILVKIAPDLDEQAITDVLAVCHDRGVAGVIAANTTIGRVDIAPADRGLAMEPGGLSGAPLTARALQTVRFVTRHTDLPVIGVGGIMTADHGVAMFDAGAALVQLYTGFLYRGPALIRAIARAAAGSP